MQTRTRRNIHIIFIIRLLFNQSMSITLSRSGSAFIFFSFFKPTPIAAAIKTQDRTNTPDATETRTIPATRKFPPTIRKTIPVTRHVKTAKHTPANNALLIMLRRLLRFSSACGSPPALLKDRYSTRKRKSIKLFINPTKCGRPFQTACRKYYYKLTSSGWKCLPAPPCVFGGLPLIRYLTY